MLQIILRGGRGINAPEYYSQVTTASQFTLERSVQQPQSAVAFPVSVQLCDGRLCIGAGQRYIPRSPQGASAERRDLGRNA